MRSETIVVSGLLVFAVSGQLLAADPKIDYGKQIAPIFRKYCVGCHNADDPEGKLDLSTFAALQRGGKKGKILVAKNVAKSRLIGMVEGKLKPFMPPKDNESPTKTEIALHSF